MGVAKLCKVNLAVSHRNHLRSGHRNRSNSLDKENPPDRLRWVGFCVSRLFEPLIGLNWPSYATRDNNNFFARLQFPARETTGFAFLAFTVSD